MKAYKGAGLEEGVDVPSKEEKLLIKTVKHEANYLLEDYIKGWRYVRILGEVLLKTVSKIESELDESIMLWNEKVGQTYPFGKRLEYLLKYQPLLSKMYFIHKVEALVYYGLLSKKKGLYKELAWLSTERNLFAHYSVYRHTLVDKYGTSKIRVKTLKKLRLLLDNVERLVTEIKDANSNSS